MINHTGSAYERLLVALKNIGRTVRETGNGAMAQCPAHHDNNPSLKLTPAAGNVLVHCHAGCDIEDVLAALDLTKADLYNTRGGVKYRYPDGRTVTRTPDKKFKQGGNTAGAALFASDEIGAAETVYVTEGEKDAANVTKIYGAPAVSPPCGAGADASRWDWSPLQGRDVIVVADRDQCGRRHAEEVATQASGIAESVRIVEPAVGNDLSDHIAAGHTLDELVDITSELNPSLLDKIGISGEWLNTQSFPELEYVVPGLISEGLGLLVAPPKKGKSFLVGDLAVAVASGGKALGHLPVTQRPVLVLALEDGYRRLKDRYTRINDDQPIPPGITFVTKASPEECVVVIREFLHRHRDRKPFIVLDTLGKVKRPRRSSDDPFQADYALGTQFKNLADSAPGSTVLVIHHTRKADASDFIDLVSGTQGLAGSVDFVLALDRKRHSNDAILSVTGRDIVEAEYALVADCGFLWRLDGTSLAAAADRADQRRDEERDSATFAKLGQHARRAVQLVNERNCPVVPSDITFRLGVTPKRASEILGRLAEAGHITRMGRGEYCSHRYANSAGAKEGAESAESPESPDSPEGTDSGASALSRHSLHSGISRLSADSVSRRINTCPCGAPLIQQASRDRGMCVDCWSSRH